MGALLGCIAMGWILRWVLHASIQRHIAQDRLHRALFFSRWHTFLYPFSSPSWIQWGNLLGDLQHWPEAQHKFRWAKHLNPRSEGALLGLGTAALALAKSPQESAQAHAFFSALQPVQPSLPPLLSTASQSNTLQLAVHTQEYLSKGWTILDDFLNIEEIELLHRFCQNDSLWRHTYTGYLGAHLDDGLSHPMIYELAHALTQALPGVFENHQLMYAWAFRYFQNHQGVSLHHDSAHVNVNLWLTPDPCNLNPQSGGLILYPENPPQEWDLERYTLSTQQMQGLIRRRKMRAESIPYRQGRMVLFNSRFLHQSEDFHFQEAPAQQRLNLTLLFGQHPLRYHHRLCLPDAIYDHGLSNT